MPFGLPLLVTIACAASTAVASPMAAAETSSAANQTHAPSPSPFLSPLSRDEEIVLGPINTPTTTDGQVILYETKDMPLADATKGHGGMMKPMKHKKKKPMGKHKKKKQTFKDKLMPLLLIPFVIQTMLIPFFITNLSLLAMKALTVGKFAILLIAFNMLRSFSLNSHSSSIHGDSTLMAQNYGYNGGPEYGSLINFGR